MANEWDSKLKTFLKKTGQDFKRAGTDIKDEAQRLLHEVKDPEGQARLRENLKEMGGWAKKTATELADLAEGGFKKAETAFRSAADNWAPQQPGAGAPTSEDPSSPPAATPPGPPPEMPQPAASAPPAKKTVGKKKSAGAGPAKPRTAAKKTLGKKSPASPAKPPSTDGDEG